MTAEDKSNVRVALRIRPLNKRERLERGKVCVEQVGSTPQIVIGQNRSFTYDYVYSPEKDQSTVFGSCDALVDSIFKGYNATILAYGQTGAGKTYTMGTQCSVLDLDSPEQQGVIPRVISKMFDKVRADTAKGEASYVLKGSFCELYKENVRDMLNPSSWASGKSLAIREDAQTGEVIIPDLSEICISNEEDLMGLLIKGSEGRTTSETLMNETSSRSHAIFTIVVEQTKLKQTAEEGNGSGSQGASKLISRFNFVDLAGSERVKRTGAKGARLKEGIAINSGLLALGNVISALGSTRNGSGKTHIPYRDSKLTRLLQHSLGGNARTLMIACISPADSSFEETLNTLKYADRARQIKNKPIVNLNMSPSDAIIVQLRKEIADLKSQLGPSAGRVLSAAPLNAAANARLVTLQHENDRLQAGQRDRDIKIASLNEKVIDLQVQRDRAILKLQTKRTSSGSDSSFASGEMSGELTVEDNILETQLRTIQTLEGKLESADVMIEKLKGRLARRKGHGGQLTARPGTARKGSNSENATPNENVISASNGMAVKPDESFDNMSDDGSEDLDDLDTHRSDGLDADDDTGDFALDNSGDDFGLDDSFEEEFRMAQQRLCELTQDIAVKEELIQDMSKNESQLRRLKDEYKTKMSGMESEIAQLQRQKEKVLAQMKKEKTKSESTQSKLKEYETRIRKLMKQMKKQEDAARQHQHLIKMRTENENRMKRLQREIIDMKKAKVALSRRLDAEGKKREQWRMRNNREVATLKRDLRKKDIIQAQLKQENERNKLLLARRIEEVNFANRKVRDLQRNFVGGGVRKKAPAGSKAMLANRRRPKTAASGQGYADAITPSKKGVRPGTAGRVPAAASASQAGTKDIQWRKQWLKQKVEKFLTTKNATEALDKALAHRDEIVMELEWLTEIKTEIVSDKGKDAPELEEIVSRMETLEESLDFANSRIDEAQMKMLAVEENDFTSLCEQEVAMLAPSEASGLVSTTLARVLKLTSDLDSKNKKCEELDGHLRDTRTRVKELETAASEAERKLLLAQAEHEQQTNILLERALQTQASSPVVITGEAGTTLPEAVSSPVAAKVALKLNLADKQLASRRRPAWAEARSSTDSPSMSLSIEEEVGPCEKKIEQPKKGLRQAKRVRKKLRRSLSTGDVQGDLDHEIVVDEPALTMAAVQAKSKPNAGLKSIPLLDLTRVQVEEARANDSSASADHGKAASSESVDDSSGLQNTARGGTRDQVWRRLLGDNTTSSLKAHKKGYSPPRKVASDQVGVINGPTLADDSATVYYESVITNAARQVIVIQPGPEPKQVFTGDNNGTLRLWDLENACILLEWVGHKTRVHAMVYSNDKTRLFSGSGDHHVKAWDPKTGEEIHSLVAPGDHSQILSLAVSDEYLFAGDDGAIRVWDINTYRYVKTMRDKSRASVFAMHVAGDYLFTGTRDGSIHVYNAKTLTYVQNFESHHFSAVTCFASANGYLYSGSRDHNVKQFKIDKLPMQAVNIDTAPHSKNINGMLIHNDILYAFSSDKTISRWDISPPALDQLVNAPRKAQRKLKSLRSTAFTGHAGSVDGACIVGDHLVTSSADKSLRVWVTPEITLYPHDSNKHGYIPEKRSSSPPKMTFRMT